MCLIQGKVKQHIDGPMQKDTAVFSSITETDICYMNEWCNDTHAVSERDIAIIQFKIEGNGPCCCNHLALPVILKKI